MASPFHSRPSAAAAAPSLLWLLPLPVSPCGDIPAPRGPRKGFFFPAPLRLGFFFLSHSSGRDTWVAGSRVCHPERCLLGDSDAFNRLVNVKNSSGGGRSQHRVQGAPWEPAFTPGRGLLGRGPGARPGRAPQSTAAVVRGSHRHTPVHPCFLVPLELTVHPCILFCL